jgi:hypothetical protein
MRKRRGETVGEMIEILSLFSAKPIVEFRDVVGICPYINEDSRRKWAAYRLRELIAMGEVFKIKRGFYKTKDSSANPVPSR